MVWTSRVVTSDLEKFLAGRDSRGLDEAVVMGQDKGGREILPPVMRPSGKGVTISCQRSPDRSTAWSCRSTTSPPRRKVRTGCCLWVLRESYKLSCRLTRFAADGDEMQGRSLVNIQ